LSGGGSGVRGQVLIFTGDGKGKTLAAFGLALRLVGHGRKVLVVQFVKKPGESGEVRALERSSGEVTVKSLGRGRLDLSARPRRAEELAQVREAWTETRRLLASERYDAAILDEVVFTVAEGFLPVADVLRFLDEKPAELTVVMTGSGNVRELIDRADYVTEMKKLKHPFDRAQEALPGIEY
jgi:cob(I)alamin adenosyltransferase